MKGLRDPTLNMAAADIKISTKKEAAVIYNMYSNASLNHKNG